MAGVYAHHFAEIRLYCWPMRRMIWPRMTKLAAMRGVGAMIVVAILGTQTSAHATMLALPWR